MFPMNRRPNGIRVEDIKGLQIEDPLLDFLEQMVRHRQAREAERGSAPPVRDDYARPRPAPAPLPTWEELSARARAAEEPGHGAGGVDLPLEGLGGLRSRRGAADRVAKILRERSGRCRYLGWRAAALRLPRRVHRQEADVRVVRQGVVRFAARRRWPMVGEDQRRGHRVVRVPLVGHVDRVAA